MSFIAQVITTLGVMGVCLLVAEFCGMSFRGAVIILFMAVVFYWLDEEFP